LGHSFDGESASDYSVCITAEVRGELCYVVDVLRDRFDYPDLRRTAIDHANRHRAELVIIENKGSGIQLLQEFSRGERGMPRRSPSRLNTIR
jgi:phage terminase large subunit-like protein